LIMSDFPLAPRAPSIHGTKRPIAALQYFGRYWVYIGHRSASGLDGSFAIDPNVWSGRA
jgi:hypothetical protein